GRGVSGPREEGRREQRGLEAVRTAVADDAAKAAKRGAAVGLLVVGKRVEESLNRARAVQSRDEPALARAERRHDRAVRLSRSARNWAGFPSIPVYNGTSAPH